MKVLFRTYERKRSAPALKGTRDYLMSCHRFLFLLTLSGTPVLLAADPFAEMVRTTPWLSPADEGKSFVLPEGFAVQLVAAEPDIGKPVSMSFDAAGRLWVAETSSYPIQGEPGRPAQDVIRILSDFYPDGRAGKNEVFAEGMLVPDAVAPYRNGAVVFSIPNIVWLQDTDGDGKCDRRDVVLGPFATNDTHNMANNFRRGFDGWMYGGQGVANRSSLKGHDGREFRMSGGAFRFRPDGSSIQKFSDGQANVFGLCFDPQGNFFTSDCHSMPIYQNIFGGFYPVFGKPHDGLGYAPEMLAHNHGSTAISGLTICGEPLWPAEFQGNFLLGNVVTSRVNRDRIEEHGSTKIALEMPDLLSSRDPWFRPVDVQSGPDGALYIADFYNRIIAHVEVPLDHPGRDRTSGRIWRVVRLGPDGNPLLRTRPDFRKLALSEKISQLGDPSMTQRLAVLNALADEGGPVIIDGVRKAGRDAKDNFSLKAASLWILERLESLTDRELAEAVADPAPILRVHALRILAERAGWKPAERELVIQATQDSDGLVARVAADGLARHPSLDQIRPLLALRHRASAADTHLVYQARKALRDQLLLPESFAFLRQQALAEPDAEAIADVCLALPTEAAAAFLTERLTKLPAPDKLPADWVGHIARHGAAPQVDALVKALAGQATRFDPALAFSWFQAAEQGMQQRSMTPGRSMEDWAEVIGRRLLEATGPSRPQGQKAAAGLAVKYALSALERPLLALVSDPTLDPGITAECLRALISLNAAGCLPLAEAFLNNAAIPLEPRSAMARELAKVNSPDTLEILTRCLRQAPERLAVNIAAALSGTGEGADALMPVISAGQAPAALLIQGPIKDRLLAVRPALAAEMTRLTANLSPQGERLKKIASGRQSDFPQSGTNAEEGSKLFQLHCAVCHSIGAKGGRIGPELDGIGHRGLERLCEDVLDPNRNVDRVFRYSVVTLKDGGVKVGLFRREEGALQVFTDATGKDFSLAKAEIVQRTESGSSLMPEIFADLLAPADFNHLMAFLLAQAAQPKSPTKTTP